MKVQNLRKLLSLDERPATGLNLPQISFNAEATQISKRICRNSGRGQVAVLAGLFCSTAYDKLRPPYRGSVRSPRYANPTPRDGPTGQVCRSLRGAAVTLRLGEFAKNSNCPCHRVP
eukprot:scaffold100619_cov47-Phaeocystis_antarctica.AAC.1